MKYCVKCGAQNNDTAKFCTECGAPFTVAAADEHTSYTYGSAENKNTSFTYEPVENESAESGPVNHTASCESTVIDTTYTYGETSSSSGSASAEDKYTYTYNSANNTGYSTAHPGIAPRNIVVAIILSFVTCGFYQLYWLFKMNDEVNELSGNQLATSGGLVILFQILTCGIYGVYWSYKMGERCDEIKGSSSGSSAILYLILTLLGFGIVTFCLIQDTINKAV